MRLLILGGTHFLGRHMVECALARGHEVTLFNRGQRNPDLFPQLERLIGDRDGHLDALKGRTWDAVIDPSGYVPRVVAQSARLLADAVAHYTFISTISVYANSAIPRQDENAELAVLDDPTSEDIPRYYGALKALCEQAVQGAMPGRALQVRPGLIVGPFDPSDRFTYWPIRYDRGGEVLAPGSPDKPVQVIDGRDLAEWVIRMVEGRQTGTFNATGPNRPYRMGEVLEACAAGTGTSAQTTWVDEAFLLEQKVQPWMGLPLWIPGDDHLMNVDASKAEAAGLRLRPLAETVAATLAWHRSRPEDTVLRAGLTPEREAEILAAWRDRQEAGRDTDPLA
jgi:2'-hydroxyisoflavone reductase